MQKPFDRSYTVVANMLYAGYYAGSSSKDKTFEKLKTLHKSGIRVLINLTEKDEIRVDGEELFQIDECVELFNKELIDKLIHIRHPIKDMNIPTHIEMNDILMTVETFINKSKPVYLFCCGGYGRTGTVVSCFLLKHNLVTKKNVFQELQAFRKEDVTFQRPSPQRKIQKDFVLNWADEQNK